MKIHTELYAQIINRLKVIQYESEVVYFYQYQYNVSLTVKLESIDLVTIARFNIRDQEYKYENIKKINVIM